MARYWIILFLWVTSSTSLVAQNTRISTRHTIGWYNYLGTFQVGRKTSIHTEYQFRRNELITEAQQGLLRVGLNYELNPRVTVRLGYAWIETFPYGEIPINAMGRDFTEHRLFQMITVKDRFNKLDLSHRFMLEQRWVGRYSRPELKHEDEFPLLNRIRYMLRAQLPLKGNRIADKTPYAAIYNELFVGFGKRVNENIFDQNRLGMLVGYRFNSTVRVELGYLNQILQVPREVNNRNVFQYNNGVVLNMVVNGDLRKRSKPSAMEQR